MPEYAPPPGSPPANVQYAPPPGAPPADSHYAPPPGAPSTDPPPSNPFLDEGEAAASSSEAPPAYTKNAPQGSQTLTLNGDGDVKFETLPPAPAFPPDADGPLDPPPSCFSTPSPARIRSHSFEPFRIPSKTNRLQDGFQPLYPPSLLGAHGITPEDWAIFLRDLQLAAGMAQQGRSAVAPNRGRAPTKIVRGILGGPRSAAGGPYDQAFVKTPQEEVST
jgi:hypothetical protein